MDTSYNIVITKRTILTFRSLGYISGTNSGIKKTLLPQLTHLTCCHKTYDHDHDLIFTFDLLQVMSSSILET